MFRKWKNEKPEQPATNVLPDSFTQPYANTCMLKWGKDVTAQGLRKPLSGAHFLTEHGFSQILWQTGDSLEITPQQAYFVLYPDGTCGPAIYCRSEENEIWRRWKSNGNSWWPGYLTINDREAIWQDAPKLLPLWLPPWVNQDDDHPTHPPSPLEGVFSWTEFYVEMTLHPEFMSAIQNGDFAASVWCEILLNREVFRISDGWKLELGSDREVSAMMAMWRRVGEDYMDFMFGFNIGERNHEAVAQLEEMMAVRGYMLAEA